MKKIRATTLTEVLVAMVIITMVSALFFAIIIRVGNFHKNRQLLIINHAMMEMVEEAKRYEYFENESLDYEQFYLIKTVQPYKNIDMVWSMHIEAFNFDNKKLGEYKAVIRGMRSLPKGNK